MKLIKAVLLILMTVVASPAFAEEPKPLGIALGTPLDEVKRVLADRPFQDNGANRYTSGPMYVVDGKGLGVSDLQRVLLIFDADRRLAALMMTMDVGGMGKPNFDRVLAHLKERYKAERIVNPLVGDKGAEFQTPGAQISIEAPHMSFQMTVAYMTKALFRQIKADVAEQGKKKADEGKRF